jgi:ribosomal protein S12 methylthiotransferase accessory factor YcaO
MKSRVDALRRFRSPYAPSIWLLGARLVPDERRVLDQPIYVLGKGVNEQTALMRLYGEAAERDTLYQRKDDDTCQQIDIDLQGLGCVPAADVRLGCRDGAGGRLGSNGCSAHNLMERAIHLAVAELIERKAVWQWWRGRVPAGRIDPMSLGLDGLAQEVSAARRGAVAPRETRFFLLRGSGPFQVVMARSTAPDGSEPAIAFAAALDVQRAAVSAFLELLSVELETADLHGARLRQEGFTRDSARGLVAARQEALSGSHASLFSAPDDVHHGQDASHWTLEQILSWYAENGEAILLFDLTRSDINLPTCRACFADRALQPVFPAGYDLSPV